MPTITVKLRTALTAKEVNLRMRMGAKILNYGRNHIEAVSVADVNFMAKTP